MTILSFPSWLTTRTCNTDLPVNQFIFPNHLQAQTPVIQTGISWGSAVSLGLPAYKRSHLKTSFVTAICSHSEHSVLVWSSVQVFSFGELYTSKKHQPLLPSLRCCECTQNLWWKWEFQVSIRSGPFLSHTILSHRRRHLYLSPTEITTQSTQNHKRQYYTETEAAVTAARLWEEFHFCVNTVAQGHIWHRRW